jgi:hypothetical protein
MTLKELQQARLYPEGMPVNWRAEPSGKMQASVTAYYKAVLGEGTITPEQIERIARFCNYFIHAPCWDFVCEGADSMVADLAELRQRAPTLASIESVRRWLQEALDIGLDPF